MAIAKKTVAKNELWRRGNLFWKCHPGQKEMYKLFYESDNHSILVWLISRQFGKSFNLAVLALEQALRKNNSIIKLLTDTKLHIKSIFEPLFRQILEDCPEDLKPQYNQSTYTYTFHNGSQIQLAGSDGGSYERLRGQKSDLVLVDEAGFCDRLEDIVKSVLLPTTTHTGGKIVLASTPSADPGHEFHKFIEEADLNGTLTKKTVYDNPLLTEDQVQRIIEQMGGVNNSKFRREYLVELARDEENVLFPEFTDELAKKVVRDDYIRPAFFHSYVGMDLGYDDMTAIMFAYYDFRNKKIVFEDEIVVKGKDLNLPKLTQAILDKEVELWTNDKTQEVNRPYQRVSDINYIVTQEMSRASNNQLSFSPAKKDDKSAAMHNFRCLLAAGNIIINPKCEVFIRHLKNGKWANTTTKKTFARSPDDGHYDTLDSACYLIRAVATGTNPFPHYYGMDVGNTMFKDPDKYKTSYASGTESIYKKIFNIKR